MIVKVKKIFVIEVEVSGTKFQWGELQVDRLNEKSKLNWILKGTKKRENNSVVANFIPTKFTHFCKIMNPFYRDKRIKDKPIIDLEPNMGDDDVIPTEYLQTMTFKELFNDLNLNYTKEISTWSLHHGIGAGKIPSYLTYFPTEGTMELEVLEETINILNSFSNGINCYYYYDSLKMIHSYPVSPEDHDSYRLYEGKLDDVFSLYHEGDKGLGSPTYWWPEDKQWCIYTDFDFDFSIIGGSKEIIDTFVANERLECIQVDAETRVDFYADKENQSKGK
jgi:hypothetical protein